MEQCTLSLLDVQVQILILYQGKRCVKSVRIWSFSGLYSVRTPENMNTKTSEYGHFLRSESELEDRRGNSNAICI